MTAIRPGLALLTMLILSAGCGRGADEAAPGRFSPEGTRELTITSGLPAASPADPNEPDFVSYFGFQFNPYAPTDKVTVLRVTSDDFFESGIISTEYSGRCFNLDRYRLPSGSASRILEKFRKFEPESMETEYRFSEMGMMYDGGTVQNFGWKFGRVRGGTTMWVWHWPVSDVLKAAEFLKRELRPLHELAASGGLERVKIPEYDSLVNPHPPVLNVLDRGENASDDLEKWIVPGKTMIFSFVNEGRPTAERHEADKLAREILRRRPDALLRNISLGQDTGLISRRARRYSVTSQPYFILVLPSGERMDDAETEVRRMAAPQRTSE